MSIFTSTFRDFVFNQLKIREAAINQKSGRSLGAPKVKGKDLKNSGDIHLPPGAFHTLTTSKQCIIRMSSGVDLKTENSLLDANEKEGGNLAGEGLAIRYMLEGGVPSKDVDFLNNRKEGQSEIKVIPRGRGTRQFTKGKGADYGSTYGDSYIRSNAGDDFGIVPMPGIIDAQIRTKTAYGSLRDAQVKFVCHNRRQLDILETLYMRPGMPILLEWGWSKYISNDGKRENYFPYLWEWFDKNENINNINKLIHKRIELSSGNYDGFVGYVKNFEIVSRPDGGYDCTTDLAAMGEIIEGLKGKNEGLKLPPDTEGNTEDREVDNLEFYLYACREYCELINKRDDLIQYYNSEVTTTNLTITPIISKFLNAIQNNVIPLLPLSDTYNPSFKFEETKENIYADVIESKEGKEIKNIEDILDSHFLYKNEKLGIEGDELDNTKSNHHYIRWDFLCSILNGLVINTYQPLKNNKPSPFTNISVTQELFQSDIGAKNYLQYSKFNFLNEKATFPRTSGAEVTANISYLLDMSVNPEVCILPHQIKGISPDNNSATKKTYNINNTPSSDRSIGHTFIGLDYLLGLFQKLRYKGDEIIEDFNLLNFLQILWEKDINNACGGTHDFLISTEKSNGDTLRVIDTTKGPEPILTPDNLYKLNIQGNTSIVRDFNYTTTIDSKLSSTIAIAAQSPTNISDLDAVSFAAFNRDVQNRFFKDLNEGESEKSQKNKAEKYDKDLESIKQMLGYLYDYRIDMLKGDQKFSMITALSFVRNLESKIISLKSRYSDTLSKDKIYKGYPRKVTNLSKSTIIPLKFNCQIDGIGGLIIGNVFKVEKKFLPKGYEQDDIAFAVLTENQTITAGQDWTTEFSGQVILLDLNKREKHEDLQLTITGNSETSLQTGNISANKTNIISEEQSNLDPQIGTLELSDNVYLKINKETTNVRTGTEVDNGVDDNIIGNFPMGNKGLLLGTIVERYTSLAPVLKWIGRIAGDPITEEQTEILRHSFVKLNGVDYERISIDSPVYNGPKVNTSGTTSGQEGIAYFSRRWNNSIRKDGYYYIRLGEKYAFEQPIYEKWYRIEFNDNAKNKIDISFINDDRFINGNQGWMRIDTLQSSETFE